MNKMLRVLVVDDNRDIVSSTMSLLHIAGHDCRPCYAGDQVMNLLGAYDPDVVLLDIGLPGKNGWDVARDVRACRGPKRPLLIAITGEHTKPDDKVRAETTGFDYYIAKPADPELILRLLAAARQLKPND
jgi:DNA-binding response OmpR family regulator